MKLIPLAMTIMSKVGVVKVGNEFRWLVELNVEVGKE